MTKPKERRLPTDAERLRLYENAFTSIATPDGLLWHRVGLAASVTTDEAIAFLDAEESRNGKAA